MVRLGRGMPSRRASAVDDKGMTGLEGLGVFRGAGGVGAIWTSGRRHGIVSCGEWASVLSDGRRAGFVSPAFRERCAVSMS